MLEELEFLREKINDIHDNASTAQEIMMNMQSMALQFFKINFFLIPGNIIFSVVFGKFPAINFYNQRAPFFSCAREFCRKIFIIYFI